MNNPDQQPLWYPYAQMKLAQPYLEVDHASGVELTLTDGRKLIDGVSSWWCAIHGYNHPEVTAAAKAQLDKVAHVMLGGLVNGPAKALAEKLVEITPEGLNHVFFSDSGSVGVEVALKMAIQYWGNQGQEKKTQFVSLERSYHGDTFKTMAVGNDECYHHAFSSLLDKAMFVPVPKGGFDADLEAMQPELEVLEALLAEHHHQLAAFVVEPCLQGAGGIQIFSPVYLTLALKLCRKYNVLCIFDEVATGFGRTGKMFAAEHTGDSPDMMILGKALTAGYIGHAATIATTEVFQQFYGDNFDNALMHGPTFMGNALACAVGLESIKIFERDNYLTKIAAIESHLKQALRSIDSPLINDIRTVGAAGCIEVMEAESLIGFQEFAVSRGVWLRPFNCFLYTMPAYIISLEDLQKVTETIVTWFTDDDARTKAQQEKQAQLLELS
jgi:adenosylmethionine-8-amino-7-oxononanoate aminotransferase